MLYTHTYHAIQITPVNNTLSPYNLKCRSLPNDMKRTSDHNLVSRIINYSHRCYWTWIRGICHRLK